MKHPFLRPTLAAIVLCSVFAPTSAVAQTVAQTQATAAETKAPPTFGILDGTPIRLRIARTVSSKDAKTGETIDFEVLDEIKVGETVVVSKDSVAIGTITRSKASGRFGRGGKLDLTIDYLRLASGEKVPLRAVKENKGRNYTGTMTGAMVAAGILFFPAAPLFLFIKGKNITVPKGTEVTAYVNGDTPLDASKFGVSQPQSVPVSADSAAVTIKSPLEGAEIEIDGKFVGSTPSTLSLKPGEYKIVIRKSGYKPWERTVTVSGGSSLNIDATLESI